LIMRKKIGLGVLVSAISLAWSIAAVKLVIPHFSQGDYKFATYRYQDFGTTTNEIIKNIILNPVKDFVVLAKPRKLYFLLVLFSSTGFVSLLGGTILILLIIPLLYLLLSSYQSHYSYTAQYSAILIPILFFAFVVGLKRLEPFRLKKIIYLLITVIVLLGTTLFGALPFSRKFDGERFKYSGRYNNFEALKTKIPPDVSLAASDFVITHLSQRRFLEFYTDETTAGYVFLDVASVNFEQNVQERQVESLKNRGYQVVDCKEGLCLLAKPINKN